MDRSLQTAGAGSLAAIRQQTRQQLVATVVDQRVEDTLSTVARLASPVVRTCHIGNNTSNVWGWLALARNTRCVQFDHTLYGVDENCIPWTLLGDNGFIDLSFDHRSVLRHDDIGLHVNDVMPKMERRYFSHLTYGIFGCSVAGELQQMHLRRGQELHRQLNGMDTSHDAREFVGERRLFEAVIDWLFEIRCLEPVFNRWVRWSRNRFPIMRRIRKLSYGRQGLRIVDVDGVVVFDGSVDAFKGAFFDGLAQVIARLESGTRQPLVGYPWVSVAFNYLTPCIKEFAVDRTQQVFWHAGGSASSYYVNEPGFQAAISEVAKLLAQGGFLPHGFRLQMIPTFSCQLFSTTHKGAEILSELLHLWQDIERRSGSRFARLLAAIATSAHPSAWLDELVTVGDVRARAVLVRLLDRANRENHNTLPIAHISGCRHPSYNKFGIAQANLRNTRIVFPDLFRSLTWGSLEICTKLLAQLTLNRRH